MSTKLTKEYLLRRAVMVSFADAVKNDKDTLKWREDCRRSAAEILDQSAVDVVNNALKDAAVNGAPALFTMELTASMAAGLLYAFGGHNRVINLNYLDLYVTDMLEGRWLTKSGGVTQPVCITEDRRLTESNKRFIAQVISKLEPIEYSFAVGISSADAAITGRQQARRPEQNAAMADPSHSAKDNKDVSDVFTEVSMLKTLLTKTPNELKSELDRKKFTYPDYKLAEIYAEYRPIVVSKSKIMPGYGNTSRTLGRFLRTGGKGVPKISKNLALGAFITFYEEDPKNAIAFFNMLTKAKTVADLRPSLANLVTRVPDPRSYGHYIGRSYGRNHCQRVWLINAWRGFRNDTPGKFTDFSR